MKNLFTQNRTLESNTRFVWNVEAQHSYENADVLKESLDVKEQEQHFKEFAENQEALNGKVDNMKKFEAGEKLRQDPDGEMDKDFDSLRLAEQKEEGEVKENRPKQSIGQRIGKMLGLVKKEDYISEDMDAIHSNDSVATQKPDITKANNEKTETAKEATEKAEVDPVTKLLGETKEDEGAGYNSTADVEGQIEQEAQGGGIGGMNIESADNFVDAGLDTRGSLGAEGVIGLDDADNIT